MSFRHQLLGLVSCVKYRRATGVNPGNGNPWPDELSVLNPPSESKFPPSESDQPPLDSEPGPSSLYP
ncbi:hypothetical protein RR46_14279 [Papilio xuthus]|uniref:Uncharacterized protein n=1 Tax=Papilio xuthus TaxID=66420 RepID=A0A194PJ42_PAPXU|nr:hypothetical protein RR46_14279 [Papilio xuthus]